MQQAAREGRGMRDADLCPQLGGGAEEGLEEGAGFHKVAQPRPAANVPSRRTASPGRVFSLCCHQRLLRLQDLLRPHPFFPSYIATP